MHPHLAWHSLIVCVVIAACGTDEIVTPDAGSMSDDASSSGTAELPPRGDDALRTWLAEGHYLTWACEQAPHDARPPGAHGMNRICSNALLAGSATGEFPVGAASVKELHDADDITGYAVAIKVAAGTAAGSWYWYERIGQSVVADDVGVALCANCHDDAPRDHVFTVVQ